MKLLAFFFVIALLSLASCSTEVELNASYKNTAVIFGLLNPDFNGDNIINGLDTQWIKINKTFLGTGDNTVFAGIRDSSEYADEDFEIKVVQRLVEGEVVEEYELISKMVNDKEVDGLFYGPDQTVYYFVPPASGLSQSSEYKIYLKFTDGREVTAITDVIDYANFAWLTPQAGSSIILAQPSSLGSVNYVDPVSVRWYAANNASVYSAVLRFHFTEVLYDNPGWIGTPISTVEKYLDYSIGSISAKDVSAGDAMKKEFSGEGFFTFIRNSLDVNQNMKRIIGNWNVDVERTECFDMILTMGNEELSSYISVNSPSSSVAQERPVYTNVDNGLGLFASRGARAVNNLRLVGLDVNNIPNPGNLYAFFVVGSTAELNFCDPNPTSDYACD